MAIKVLPTAIRQQKQAGSYAAAQAQGRGNEWLASHKKIAKRMGATPGVSGIKNGQVKGIVGDAIEGDRAAGSSSATILNPTTSTAFGSTELTFGPDGKPIYTQTESDSQRGIREQGEALTNSGLGAAQGIVNNYSQLNWQGSPEERQRIEQEVYGRLTRNIDEEQKQEFGDMEQRMYNRGIPLDPTNPAYKRELDALNEKYNNLKENAASQATILGGLEMARSYDIAKQSHAQGMSDISTLSGSGIGYQASNLPGYSSPTMPTTSTSDIATNLLGFQTQKDIANINANAASGDEEESPLD